MYVCLGRAISLSSRLYVTLINSLQCTPRCISDRLQQYSQTAVLAVSLQLAVNATSVADIDSSSSRACLFRNELPLRGMFPVRIRYRLVARCKVELTAIIGNSLQKRSACPCMHACICSVSVPATLQAAQHSTAGRPVYTMLYKCVAFGCKSGYSGSDTAY